LKPQLINLPPCAFLSLSWLKPLGQHSPCQAGVCSRPSYQRSRRVIPALCLDPRLANSAACPEALRFRYYGLMCQSCPLLLTSLFTLVSRSLQFGPPSAGGQDLPGVISANPSMDAWTPTPADSVVLLPVSSHQASAFPPLAQGRLLPFPEKRFLLGVPFRGCSHSVMFRPPSLLATQVAPTDMTINCHMAAVTFTSEHRKACYLTSRRIC
jgi:hypothetical protein